MTATESPNKPQIFCIQDLKDAASEKLTQAYRGAQNPV